VIHRRIGLREPTRTLALWAKNLSAVVLAQIDGRARDLVHLAAYVYAADQELSRGGPADVHGKRWRRDITLCVPVMDPDFWNDPAIVEALTAVLYYATEDTWHFLFSQDTAGSRQLPLGLSTTQLVQQPDAVLLFSGGADSLCATVDAVAARGQHPVLVSHCPAPNFDAQQQQLAGDLRRRFERWAFPHLGFSVHRMGSDAPETTQRTRAFLFASLGSAVADQLKLSRVLLADNGIVSLGLPINGSLIGAYTSRSTHPKFLTLFNQFVARVLTTPLEVSNPLWDRTRAETLKILRTHECPELLGATLSCGHRRNRPKHKPQCGYCSQCVDRRFGAIAAELEDYDPAERYEIDIFPDALQEGEPRTVAASYLQFAYDLDLTPEDQVFAKHMELYECLPEGPAAIDTARALVDLLKRHAVSTLEVAANMVARWSLPLVRKQLPGTSLLRLALNDQPMMTAGPQEGQSTTSDAPANICRREGQFWRVTFQGTTVHLRDMVGLRYLVPLLRQPCRELPVQTLAALAHGTIPAGDVANLDDMTREEREAEGLPAYEPDDLGAMLDPQARQEYKQELQRLHAQLQDERIAGDPEAFAKLKDEAAFIEKALRAARRLGGEFRRLDDPVEKPRRAAGAALRRVLDALRREHPALAEHLRVALTMGATCVYRPEPPVTWLT
jgi:7-cyano-7-deazaguanine synthase in queuosine biosynthesis